MLEGHKREERSVKTQPNPWEFCRSSHPHIVLSNIGRAELEKEDSVFFLPASQLHATSQHIT